MFGGFRELIAKVIKFLTFQQPKKPDFNPDDWKPYESSFTIDEDIDVDIDEDSWLEEGTKKQLDWTDRVDKIRDNGDLPPR